MGWHLRFSRGFHLRVLALNEARGKLENVLELNPLWELSISEKKGYIQADYVRKKGPDEPC